MLRVLTVSTLFPDTSRPTFGGFVARQTLGLAARDGVAVTVVAPRGIAPGLGRHPHYRALAALPEREDWQGLTVLRPRFSVLPGIGAAQSARLLARTLLPLVRGLRDDGLVDVIDAEFFWPDGPAAVAVGRRLGLPVSIKARGSDVHVWGERPAVRRQIVAAARAADGLLAVSGALKADMAAMGMPGERIRVHHTGVHLDRFRPIDRAAAKAALGLAGPLLIGVGHLIERKGPQIAIEAMAALPGVTLLLAGEGALRPALEARIAALGLGDRVRLLGRQAHDALPALFAAADATVLPTVSEGLANVWVESLACGTPVVTTDVGGAREVIDRPAAGRLVARDPGAVATAVRDLLAHPQAQAETRACAARFTWEANAAALHGHLTGLVTPFSAHPE